MGLRRNSSCNCFECLKASNINPNPNPDPNNWKVLKSKEMYDHLILMIEYPGCLNYEGKKILVFENISLVDLINQRQIDPHFCDAKGSTKSPIARFEPTERGWAYAQSFVATMRKPQFR